jgi:phage shock protein PspC (stress-responsive transcriptional regulator)
MFCAHCGNQYPAESNFCSACGASGVRAAYAASSQARIVRPRYPRMIAGVCSGIAIYNGWDIGLLRVLVVIATILTGGIVLVGYIAAWLLIPDALYALPPSGRQNDRA